MASFSQELHAIHKTAAYGKKEIVDDLHAALHAGVSNAGSEYAINKMESELGDTDTARRFGRAYVAGMLADTAADTVLGERRGIKDRPFLPAAATALAEKGLEHLANTNGVYFGSMPVRAGALAAGGQLVGRSAVRAYDAGLLPSPLRLAAAPVGAAAGQLLGIPASFALGALARKLLKLSPHQPLPFDALRAGASLGAAGGAALGDYVSGLFTGDASVRDALITGLGAGTGAAITHNPGGGELRGAMPGALAGSGLAHLLRKVVGTKKKKAPKKETYAEYADYADQGE